MIFKNINKSQISTITLNFNLENCKLKDYYPQTNVEVILMPLEEKKIHLE